MVSTFSTELRLEQIATGEKSGTWGTINNLQMANVEAAIAGTITVQFASNANDTLVAASDGTDDEARHMFVKLTSGVSLTATRNMVVPTSSKLYFVHNATTGGAAAAVQIIGATGTGTTVPNGAYAALYHDGTNVIPAFDHASTLTAFADTSAGDLATMGYTPGEGLILTGQGSTNDVTIKNDADGEVMGVLTGTTTAAFKGQVTAVGAITASAGVELGHATDTTITRASAGDLNIEGNIAYRAGGTDVPVADGGTGVSTLTDGGILVGSGTGAVTAMAVLADGEIIVGDGTTDPVAESGATARTSLGAAALGANSDITSITGLTTDLTVAQGGTGAGTFTDGGILLGSGTGAVTAMAVLADSEMIVGDGTTDPVAESGATLRTSIGVGTGDSPQLTGIELGHATDSTITRASAGDINVEGNVVYRAGGTDVPVADGGTGVSTLTDGGILLGSGTGAITAMAVLADGEIIVGDGTTDPVAESGATARTSLGAAALGANSDITSITGLTTDLTVAQGGTGAGTFTDGGILLGSGTGAITAMAVLATGEMIVGDGTTDPGAVSLSGDVTINSSGVVTIAATSVEGSMLNTNVISGQTALTSSLALTDELLVSDAGTLKRMDISLVTGLASADATALAIALG